VGSIAVPKADWSHQTDPSSIRSTMHHRSEHHTQITLARRPTIEAPETDDRAHTDHGAGRERSHLMGTIPMFSSPVRAQAYLFRLRRACSTMRHGRGKRPVISSGPRRAELSYAPLPCRTASCRLFRRYRRRHFGAEFVNLAEGDTRRNSADTAAMWACGQSPRAAGLTAIALIVPGAAAASTSRTFCLDHVGSPPGLPWRQHPRHQQPQRRAAIS
jgi:hypothetical protein